MKTINWMRAIKMITGHDQRCFIYCQHITEVDSSKIPNMNKFELGYP